MQRLWGYLKTPTFSLIVFQGLFGMIPWNAMGYFTLFLQTAGLGSYQAAFVSTLGRATQGLGQLLGGYVGDVSAARWPHHGRPLVAQISVLSGIPLAWIIFQTINPSPDNFIWYCFLYGLVGLVATWCGTGVNWPIFTEIVPEEGRSVVVAWDTAFEGISGALIGNLAVAFLAQNLFGYTLDTEAAAVQGEANARALGRALAWTTIAPLLVCLVIYSTLHWSYPRDMRRLAGAASARVGSERAIEAPG